MTTQTESLTGQIKKNMFHFGFAFNEYTCTQKWSILYTKMVTNEFFELYEVKMMSYFDSRWWQNRFPRQRANYLGVVGLLDFLLVEADLLLVLGSKVNQSLGELAVELLLPPAVNLHHAGLKATLGVTQLLQTEATV